MTNKAARNTLHRAVKLIRRLDTFCDHKLEEGGIPARQIATDLLELSNDLAMYEAIERIHEMHLEDTHSVFQVTIPAPIARGLIERGYNRAKLRITDEGLLFTPYHSDDITDSRNAGAVTLPDWSGTA